ncbi:DUF1934 domain-containing protein [Brevibacillus migulae]|uniref:DUF1934 domain-containing protein n=1 Tax=Brevibacillus migulae TaxID=1644114 RepID=UPI001430FA1B|nr:DUF1934 domain-containing protein [Brevibacillus migulae]
MSSTLYNKEEVNKKGNLQRMKDVTIRVSIIHTQDGQTEHHQMETTAKAAEKESGWFFTYTEEMEEGKKVPTIVKITESMLSLLRQGHVNMKQEFEKGKQSESMYVTPYGRFRMEIYTRKLQVIQTAAGRPEEARVFYQQWLDGQYLGDYELHFLFRWMEA